MKILLFVAVVLVILLIALVISMNKDSKEKEEQMRLIREHQGSEHPLKQQIAKHFEEREANKNKTH